MQELMLIPEEKTQLLQLFVEAKDLTSELDKIREKAKDLPLDMSVRKNREEVASFAYKIARSKTAVDKAGAALSAEYKEIPKKIDANRRVYKDAFESLQAEVRQPLTEWENVEQARKYAHEKKIDWLNNWNDQLERAPSSVIKQRMVEMEAVELGERWQEYEAEAGRAKDAALTGLRGLLATTEQREAEQAELEQLRKAAAEQEQKDREAQIAREAAEQARKEAEQAAQAEREKANRDRIAAAIAADQAERALEIAEQRRIAQETQAKLDAIEAEKRAAEQAEAARQAEIDRQAAEDKRIEDERLKREADKQHKGVINRKALADLVEHTNLTEEQAKLVIKCIAKRLITNVSINY